MASHRSDVLTGDTYHFWCRGHAARFPTPWARILEKHLLSKNLRLTGGGKRAMRCVQDGVDFIEGAVQRWVMTSGISLLRDALIRVKSCV